MSSQRKWSSPRKTAILSGITGVLFLVVVVLEKDWDWRRGLAAVAAVLYLIISVLQYRKAGAVDSR